MAYRKTGRRGRTLRGLCAAVLLAVSAAAPARAWLSDGHMATGALAYDDLVRRDPAAAAAVVRIMAAHPDRARFDAALGALQGAARDRRLFELMARWPDDVRRTPYDRDSWHYSQKLVSPWRYLLPPAFGGAERAFPRALAIARNPRAPASDRAVALCWVFHITGDMHEPLHAALWMDRRFPLTDQGGNAAWVRAAAGQPPQKLHWFWDSAGGAAGRGRDSPAELEARLERKHPDPSDPAPARPAAAFRTWVAESRTLARDVVYRRGELARSPTPGDAPLLDASYVAQTQAIATARLAQAGWRLGSLLAGVR